jgi:hypothetical protein
MRTFSRALARTAPRFRYLAAALLVGAAVYIAIATSAQQSTAAVSVPLSYQSAVPMSDGRNPVVATDANGRTTAVWTRLDSNRDIGWSTLNARGGWSPPKGFATSSYGEAPEIAVSPNGHVVVAWEQSNGKIGIAIRRAGNAKFDSVVSVGTQNDPSERNQNVAVDIGTNGNAVIAWDRSDVNIRRSIEAVLFRNNAFGAVQVIDGATSDTQNGFEPEVTIDGSGNAVIVYEYENDSSANEVRQALAPAGSSTWTTSVVDTLAQSANSATHYLSIDSTQNGTLIGTWSGICSQSEVCTDWPYAAGFTGTTTTGLTSLSKQRLSNPGSDSGGPATMSSTVAEGYYPAATIDEQDRGMILWEMEPDPAPNHFQAATNTSGSAYGTTFEIGTGRDGFALEHQIDSAEGVVVMVWGDLRSGDSKQRIYTNIGYHGGNWSTPLAVGPIESDSPDVSLAANGVATIVWRDVDKSSVGLRTTLKDRFAPLITVPKNGFKIRSTNARKPSISIDCPGGEIRCVGKVTLKLGSVVVAKGTFNIAGTVWGSAKLKLTAAGRALLFDRGSIRVKARIVVRDPAGNTRILNRKYKLVRGIDLVAN